MDITFSKPQKKVYTSLAKYVACTAGLGSGKTFTVANRMLNTYFQYKGCHLVYLAPTYSLIRDIIYPLLEELLLEANVPYNLNKSDSVLTVPGYGRIFFRSMTKPEGIVGFSVLDAFLDELDVIPEAQAEIVMDKILARIRQKIPGKRNQIYVISSPEGYKYLYNNFEKEPLKDSELIRMTTYSNARNLPDDYISSMYDKYPKSLIDAYLLGKFVNLTALGVWAEFDRHLNHTNIVADSNAHLHVGMDFNVGRGSAIIHMRTKKRVYAVDEITNTIDTPATIAELRGRYPNNKITVYPDASGKSRKSTNATTSDIALLKEAKFLVKKKSKNPNIKDRVTATNAMFCNGSDERRYFVNTNTCPTYTEALEHQVYDDKGLPVKDGKIDDITDSGSYPIAYLFPVKSNRMSVADLGGH